MVNFLKQRFIWLKNKLEPVSKRYKKTRKIIAHGLSFCRDKIVFYLLGTMTQKERMSIMYLKEVGVTFGNFFVSEAGGTPVDLLEKIKQRPYKKTGKNTGIRSLRGPFNEVDYNPSLTESLTEEQMEELRKKRRKNFPKSSRKKLR